MMQTRYSKCALAVAAGAFAFIVGCAARAGTETANEKILDKVSMESNTAMLQVRWARVALFDGEPDRAKDFLKEAKQNLGAAEKAAPELTVTVKSQTKVGDKTVTTDEATQTMDYVPIDAGLVLAEDFVPTPDKEAKIKEANEHLKKGDSAKAVETLRAADIEVSASRVLMPLKTTMKHVDTALALLDEHKYYQANLALKAAEDGLITDTVVLYGPVAAPSGDEAKKES